MAADSKRYILDTSVILDDPNNILRLYDKGTNCIYITNIVLAELNNKKEDIRSEAGYRAREFFRLSDNEDGHPITQKDLPYLPKEINQDAISNDRYYQLTIQYSQGDTSADESTSVPLFVIYRDDYQIAKTHKEPYGLNDAKIGEVALDYKLTLITSDISFKIAAQVQGIPAQTLRYAQVKDPNEINFDLELPYEKDSDLSKQLDLEDFRQITFKKSEKNTEGQEYETGLTKHAISINNVAQMCDFDTRFGEHFDQDLVRPINVEQKFFYTILTHPQNYITVVAGATGSGKTLIALQAGLELVKDGIVEGIVYARNTVTSSDQQAELGFRKGDEGEKLGYFMYPLYSAVNYTIEQMKTH
ncbi:MAG: PhoH family protein [Thiovulaceae bacterium]|nr:PhoH family protein [Sulfurimonadaceae bacterium]